MVRVFISQPMQGKTSEQIRTEHNEWADRLGKLSNEEIEVMDTIFDDLDNEDPATPLKCLGMSLYMMADADIVVFLPGWSSARGCKVEHECAEKYGKKIIDYDNWYDLEV